MTKIDFRLGYENFSLKNPSILNDNFFNRILIGSRNYEKKEAR
jgi:hypothetical protein